MQQDLNADPLCIVRYKAQMLTTCPRCPLKKINLDHVIIFKMAKNSVILKKIILFQYLLLLVNIFEKKSSNECLSIFFTPNNEA